MQFIAFELPSIFGPIRESHGALCLTIVIIVAFKLDSIICSFFTETMPFVVAHFSFIPKFVFLGVNTFSY